MKVLVASLFLLYLVWAYIRYDPKLDRVKNGDNSYVILWYNSYCWGRETERKYVILF